VSCSTPVSSSKLEPPSRTYELHLPVVLKGASAPSGRRGGRRRREQEEDNSNTSRRSSDEEEEEETQSTTTTNSITTTESNFTSEDTLNHSCCYLSKEDDNEKESSCHSSISSTSTNNNNNNSHNMNFFKKMAKKALDEEKAKTQEIARRKTAEAEIRHLYEVGTAREALEGMYSAEDVAHVVEQMDKERALLAMLEAEEESRKEKEAAEKATLHEEIRGLYEAGTKADMLEQMYSSKDVQEVVEKVELERQLMELESPGGNAAGDAEAEEEEEDMTEEERAEMIEDIKTMLKANTGMSTVEAMFKPKYIQQAQDELDKEQEESQQKEIESALSEISANSKLILHLKGLEESFADDKFHSPTYNVSSKGSDGKWHLAFKSKPLVINKKLKKFDWEEARIPLEKLLNDGNAETPLRIEFLNETSPGNYHSVGHADIDLTELVKRAVQGRGAKSAKKGDARSIDESLAIAVKDKKGHTMVSLVVMDASIFTHQETAEERAAKSKIFKSLKNVEEHSKLSLCLRAIRMEEWANAEPFVQVEAEKEPQASGEDAPSWQVVYTSEHISESGEFEWKPCKISFQKLLLKDGGTNKLSQVRISMFDWNGGKSPKAMGSFVTTLNEVLWRTESHKLSSKLLDEDDKAYPCIDEAYDEEYGSVIVKEASIQKMSSEEKTARADISKRLQKLEKTSRVHLDLRATDLQSGSGFLFEIASQQSDGSWVTAYTSKCIKDTLEPDWKQAKISLGKLLTDGDISTKIRITLFDWGGSGERRRLGSFDTTLDELLLRSETSIAARAMSDELPFACCDEVGQSHGSIVVVDGDIAQETEQEKEARSTIFSSLDNIDEYSTLEIALKGINLANMDGFMGASDPFFIISSKAENASEWQAVYRSEHVDDNLNPVWKTARVSLKKLVGDDVNKKFRIDMYDFEDSGSHQAMGYFQTTVRDILWRSKSNPAAKSLGEDAPFVCRDDDDKEYGSIVVVESSVINENDDEKAARKKISETLQQMDEFSRLKISLKGTNLVNMDGFLGASDPFFELQSKDVDGGWVTVYKSEHMDDTLNPEWREAKILVSSLLGGELAKYDKQIRITLTDWESSGEHQPMGYFDTNLMELLWRAESNDVAVSLGDSRTFPCRDEKGIEYGTVIVVDASMLMDAPEERAARFKIKQCLEKPQDKSNVILTLRGQGLANVEGWLGCSDPFFEIAANKDGENWSTVYRSEHLENNLNPEWKPAIIPMHALLAGDTNRKLKVSLFDWEANDQHQTMGHFYTTIQELLWRAQTNEASTTELQDRAYIARAEDEREFGAVYIVSASIESLGEIALKMKSDSADEQAVSSTEALDAAIPPGSELLLTLKGINLANVEGWFGCSDPFFRLSVLADELAVSEDWRIVYESKHIDNCLNPEWEQATISLDSLLKGGDIYRDILISVFDWEENEAHRPMGSFKTTAHEILDRANAYSDGSNVADFLFTLKDDAGYEYGTIVVAGASLKLAKSRRQTEMLSMFMNQGDMAAQLQAVADDASSGSDEKEEETPDNADEDDSVAKEQVSTSSTSEKEMNDVAEAEPGDHAEDHSVTNEQGSSFSTSEKGVDAIAENDVSDDLPATEKDAEIDTTLDSGADADFSGNAEPDDPAPDSAANSGVDIVKPEKDSDEDYSDVDVEGSDADVASGDEGSDQGSGSFDGGGGDDDISQGSGGFSGDEGGHGDGGGSGGDEGSRDDGSQGQDTRSVATLPALLDLVEGSELSLTLEGADLPNGSPFFVVSSLFEDGDDERWQTKYTSEHIDNSLSPAWTPASISLDALLDGDFQDVHKPILVSIFDWEESGTHRPIGDFETTLNELMSRAESGRVTGEEVSYVVEDNDGGSKGRIIVVSATVISPPSQKSEIEMLYVSLEGVEMDDAEGWHDCADLLFRVETEESGDWKTIYESEPVEGTDEPIWEEASIRVDKLCGGNMDKEIEIAFFGSDAFGKSALIGSYRTTVNELLDMGEDVDNKTFEVEAEDGLLQGKILVREAFLEPFEDKSVDKGAEPREEGARTDPKLDDVSLGGSEASSKEADENSIAGSDEVLSQADEKSIAGSDEVLSQADEKSIASSHDENDIVSQGSSVAGPASDHGSEMDDRSGSMHSDAVNADQLSDDNVDAASVDAEDRSKSEGSDGRSTDIENEDAGDPTLSEHSDGKPRDGSFSDAEGSGSQNSIKSGSEAANDVDERSGHSSRSSQSRRSEDERSIRSGE